MELLTLSVMSFLVLLFLSSEAYYLKRSLSGFLAFVFLILSFLFMKEIYGIFQGIAFVISMAVTVGLFIKIGGNTWKRTICGGFYKTVSPNAAEPEEQIRRLSK